jgi:hypothetical protein
MVGMLPSDVGTRRRLAVADDMMVTLNLAHPLTADQARRVRAKEDKEYPTPGMEITVPRDDARTLIDAGYASGVDPNDKEAVAAVLAPRSSKASSKASTKSSGG